MPANIQSSLSGSQTTVGNSFMSSSAIASAVPPPTISQTTSTHISAPSEVSQNTAISDRPKVKPVSKKDVKNLRKAAAVLQQNQIVSVYNNSVCIFVIFFFLLKCVLTFVFVLLLATTTGCDSKIRTIIASAINST